MLETINNSESAFHLMFHKNAGPYRNSTGGELELNMIRERLQRVLLETIFAYGRRHCVSFISVGTTDLIADCGTKYNRKEPFARPFVWEVLEAVGMRGSCGNGRTDEVYQYQFSFNKFDKKFHGIYDPNTGKRFFDIPFCLRTYGSVLTETLNAVRNDPNSVPNLLDQIYRERNHEWGKER